MEMNQLPTVSVIMPSVKRPHRLWQALTSVAQQTYPAIEAVVVNDGGIDVEHLVQQYNAQYKRPAKYIALPQNRGVAGARNAGIASATGEIIALLDDDDRYRSEHLQRLVTTLMNEPDAILTYDDVLIHIEEGTEDDIHPRIIGTCRLGRAYDKAIFDQDDFIPPSTQVFRHADFERWGPFDEVIPICEDWDFLLRLCQHGNLRYVPGQIGVDYSYRIASGDNLGSQFGEHRLRALNMLSKRYDLPPLQPKTFLDVARDLGFPITMVAGH